MKQKMQIFSVVGPLGSGKTTFFLNLIKRLDSQGFPTKSKIAYVINDEGNNVDGELGKGLVEVVAMTNGCFTCLDTEDLKTTLVKLERSGITWVFLEGFGITAGNETRQFLESCHYPFHILSLLSAKHYEQDLIRHASILSSQVRVATIAVGITKHTGNKIIELDGSGIIEFVGKEKPGTPVVLIEDSFNVPDIVFNLFFEEKPIITKPNYFKNIKVTDHKHSAGCGCGHHSKDLMNMNFGKKVHGMFTYSYELKPDVTLGEIRQVFKNKDFLLRVKGSTEGYLFNEVHGEWVQTTPDPRMFVTFYTSIKVDLITDLPDLMRLIVMKEENEDNKASYRQIREEVSSQEDTIKEIKKIFIESLSEPIIFKSRLGLRLITHPEGLQIAKEISRRPYVKDEWFPQVLKQFMSYWIKCSHIVINREAEITRGDIAKNKYELAVSMTWWVNRYGDFFGDEIVQAVKILKPGSMAAEGILTLQNLVGPKEDGICWQCLEFTEALSYGLEHSDDPKIIIKAAEHCLLIATTEELRKAWSESLKKLTEQAKIGA